MPEKLIITAPAKVNLSLRVTGRRDDGYHELESLVAFAGHGDTLELCKASVTRLTVEGLAAEGWGAVPADETNLIIRALRCLEAHIGISLVTDIRLHKNLPVAGGLGGGSADAAAVLNGLTRLFELDVSEVQCAELARALGADVPACLAPVPGWMTGTGVDITRLDSLPAADIILINPRIALPTDKVFAALNCHDKPPAQPSPPPDIQNFEALCDFVTGQGNDLTAPATEVVPEIAACLVGLLDSGAACVGMSGSGASCFGLARVGDGQEIAGAYRKKRENDWCTASRLIGAGDAEITQLYQ
ncbi:MAG: 4-(cytidine 5'-diphospho)-2-C-methyl-D-erythritol kinase [Pseudomonadota bacterium]|nr:4-(cytidine 5'-diphospho)-2-C-methyl-D-erythritol kinase [Pseudomonadota bacterium]